MWARVMCLLVLGAVSIVLLGVAEAAAIQPLSTATGLYFGGNAGYGWRDWHDMTYWQQPSSPLAGGFFGGENGFAAIVDAGYQFTPNVSAELGWLYISPASIHDAASGISYYEATSAENSNGTFYAGLKVQAPVSAFLSVYGELAGAYSFYRFHFEDPVLPSSPPYTYKTHYWSPYWAAGLQYNMSTAFILSLQYAYVSAYTQGEAGGLSFNCPSVSVVTFGVAYKIVM